MWADNLKCLFILLSWLLHRTRGASHLQNRVKARIGKKLSMNCPLPISRLLHMSWNRCATEDQCRANWDKSRIARITDKTIVSVDHPERYELGTNGTLTVKEVIPQDDNKLFICRGKIRYEENVENVTVLEIIREQPKVSTRIPLEYEVIEGMALILEFKVHGYPHPLVSLRHNHDILFNGTKVEPMFVRQNATQSYNGKYTYTAENPLGNTSITITVKVIAQAAANSTCQGNGTAVSTRELEHECRGSTVGFGIGIPITLVVGIVLGLLLGRLRQGKENRVAADDALQPTNRE